MKKLAFILLTQFVFAQQIPIDSISYEYFYEKELEQIVLLKKHQKIKSFNAKKQLEIADLYRSINCEDSAYASYYKIYEHEKETRTFSDEEFKELLFSIHKVETSKHNYTKERRFFLNALIALSKNDTNDKWKAKTEQEIAIDFFVDSSDYDAGYHKMLAIQSTNYYKNNKEFKAATLSTLGNFNITLKEYETASSLLNECFLLAKQNDDYLHQSYAKINMAVNQLNQQNYEAAINNLNDIKTIPNKKYLVKINRIVHKLKKRVYDSLKDAKNSNIQKLYVQKYDSLVNDFRKNSNFYEIDVAYQVKEKDRKIKELAAAQEASKKNKIVYSILLFCVFLLALYSFVRWKKVDRRKRLLTIENQSLNIENEKTKTELETVKSLVTNDYILLKNKSKVYLKELIYVNADGHYLNLYTNTKKEFVRGKISEIETQLPPNFIKCHRSYIVNQNCIKQFANTEVFMVNGDAIPLSRGFKF
ncbi:LytTR family DNA-binding domain-containing protein [Lacinutrix jangbogonensis]|uniref:LytTR family DNA-binding domain-containing protein n=1 Tax=Lacinutrix jangbogonensis TaxID=1469557 RepID=UPI00053F0601|nr:LytTR family DNA-binding domain-containing protein [Lacinutrix jangbogonensis]